MIETAAPRVALAIVAQARCKAWETLENIPAAVEALRKGLTESGGRYEHCLPELISGGTKPEVEAALGRWLRGLSPRDRAVVYWTGHGTGGYLVTRESPKTGLGGDVAFKGSAFGDLIARSPAEKILVIVDACYASAEAQGIAEEILAIRLQQSKQPGQIPWVGVIPSASACQKATEGVFCRALLDVLTAAEAPGRKWTDNTDYIDANDLADGLIETALTKLGKGYQEPMPATFGRSAEFLPNPRYRGPQPAMDVETRRGLLAVPEALELAASGGIEAGEAGSYFTGRTAALERLAGWLGETEPNLLVITGAPGSGKSALLGRLVMLSDPRSRAGLEKAGSLSGLPLAALPPEVGSTLRSTSRAWASQSACERSPRTPRPSCRRRRSRPTRWWARCAGKGLSWW